MRGRNKHDVFVIGEEALAETETLRATDDVAPPDAQEPESQALPCLERRRPHGPGARRRARWLAAIGIAAVPAAALALLELSSAGRASRPQRLEASAPAAPPAPAALPSSRPREQEPGGDRQAPAQRRGRAEREPTNTEAPVSPPPAAAPSSDPDPAPAPPSPSPPSGGGDSGGIERFGFER
jgi:hypothetical protein